LDDTARSVVPFGGYWMRELAGHSHLRPLSPHEVARRFRVL
jgi:hypothetical protein